MTRPTRLRRSELSTPGTSEKMIVKAAASTADLVFLDLEDAVAPAEKEKARQPIIAALNDLDWGHEDDERCASTAPTPIGAPTTSPPSWRAPAPSSTS